MLSGKQNLLMLSGDSGNSNCVMKYVTTVKTVGFSWIISLSCGWFELGAHPLFGDGSICRPQCFFSNIGGLGLT